MSQPTTRRALVVEDDASIRELLRLHLDLAGFTIDEADDGRIGLERARASAFDVILLDVMLPGLDGVSVCRAIRHGGCAILPAAQVDVWHCDALGVYSDVEGIRDARCTCTSRCACRASRVSPTSSRRSCISPMN